MRRGFLTEVIQNPISKVDLLFMIDDSGSMSEEQASVREQLPRLVSVLTSGDPTPNAPMSGDEFTPIKDLHVAIVTSDLGSAGFPRTTCESVAGDDGLFSTPVANMDGRRPMMASGCPALPTTPPFLAYATGQDASRFATDFTCLANLGTRGCGVEQQLEAPLKALWPPAEIMGASAGAAPLGTPCTTSADCGCTLGEDRCAGTLDFCQRGSLPSGWCTYNPARTTDTLPFALGSKGHGQDEHAGFLRPDSVLAIVVVTDEEDSSVRDTNVFDDASQYGGTDLNLRLAGPEVGGFGPEAGTSIGRYVAGFRALRAENPERLVFAAITGVPPDSPNVIRDAAHPRGGEGTENLDAILADPRMQYAIDTGDPAWTCTATPDCRRYTAAAFKCTPQGQCVPAVPYLRPSCNNQRGIATPPRRVVQLARDLSSDGRVAAIVQSICQENFAPAFDAIIAKIADALGSLCLPRRLNTDEMGRVNCKVVETLPAGMTCASMVAAGASASPIRTTTNARGERLEVCAVTQLAHAQGEVPAASAGEGWYYDDFSPDTLSKCSKDATAQRIVFTPGGVPVAGARVNLECLQNVATLTGGGAVDVGTFCTPGDATPGDALCAMARVTRGTTETPLFCEVGTRVCQLACSDTSDCPPGYACATQRGDVNLTPADMPLSRSYCVNPTCN